MNEILLERLRRKLEALPDEKAYEVLDFIEFLESKYAERAAGAPAFQKVAETLEDTMRAARVPVSMIKGTMEPGARAAWACSTRTCRSTARRRRWIASSAASPG